MIVAELDEEIAAYEQLRGELEARYMGQWILVHDHQLIGVHHSFEEDAGEAVQRFGRGPFLIRQVGAPPVTLPVVDLIADGQLHSALIGEHSCAVSR